MKKQIDFLLQNAVDKFQQGNLSLSKTYLEKILISHPKNFNALHLMGVILGIEKQPEKALVYFYEAVKINPNDYYINFNLAKALSENNNDLGALPYHEAAIKISPKDIEAKINFGNSLLKLKRFNEAIFLYEQAIQLKPDFAEAWASKGATLRLLKRYDEALISHDQAIKIKPDFAEAWSSKGVTFYELKRYDEALTYQLQAIKLNPNFAEAWAAMGVTFRDLKQYDKALTYLDQAIKIKPDFAEAWSSMGITLHDMRRHNDAIICFNQAIKLKPSFAEAWSSKGVTLHDCKLYKDAIEHYDKAIEFKSDFAEAWSSKGVTLHTLKHYDKAISCFNQATKLNPSFAEAFSNLGVTLSTIGEHELADKNHRKAIQLNPDFFPAYNNLLFNLNYLKSFDPGQAINDAKKFGFKVSKKSQPKFTNWDLNLESGKLNIGFVSGDLRTHSVGHFIEGLISNINPKKFQIYAFPSFEKTDSLTDRIRPFFKEWVPIFGISDFEAASIIHGKGIQILVDLSGHTAHNRLPVFSFKPAPIQVSWLGYPATTGLPEIDYILGDSQALPTEYANQFTEKIWHLPQTYLCLTPPKLNLTEEINPFVANGFITFGSFNNLSKINERVIETWSNILKSVPNSKLHLKTEQLSNVDIKIHIEKKFANLGITLSRLILSGTTESKEKHFETYNSIDIALDTFPYPGVTTTAEALWMGVPTISLKGNSFLSSTAKSILFNVGMIEYLANDIDDYVNKAIKLANDIECLKKLRLNLRLQSQQSSLFNPLMFSENFGNALWNIWYEYVKSNISLPKD